MIDLYTAPTPNGWKAAIALEEFELGYTPHVVSLKHGEHYEDWFKALNPNCRIPVIVDRDADDLVMFESGAILFYLAEKTGRLMPSAGPDRHAVMQWLMFQMSGIGPMQGQAVTFERYFPEDVPVARIRYHNETRRLYEVLDSHLAGHEWLAGDFSIADIANWPGSGATSGPGCRSRGWFTWSAGWTPWPHGPAASAASSCRRLPARRTRSLRWVARLRRFDPRRGIRRPR